MSPKLFEVVPNFSEGRDAEKVSRIADSVRAVPGVRVLDLHSDPDHNRSVLTLVGEKEPLVEASVALARACVREIDLAVQRGVHPRIGSLDVLPFVPLGPPLSEATLQEAVRLKNGGEDYRSSRPPRLPLRRRRERTPPGEPCRGPPRWLQRARRPRRGPAVGARLRAGGDLAGLGGGRGWGTPLSRRLQRLPRYEGRGGGPRHSGRGPGARRGTAGAEGPRP